MTEQKSSSVQKKRNDLVFIGLLLLAAVVGILYLFVFRGGGNVVKVTVDGELYGVYSLSEDRTEEIHMGADGGGFNRLIIKDGKAWIETASCPDGICAAHKPIHRDGESIVCLPNKVVVTVQVTEGSQADEPGVDAVI